MQSLIQLIVLNFLPNIVSTSFISTSFDVLFRENKLHIQRDRHSVSTLGIHFSINPLTVNHRHPEFHSSLWQLYQSCSISPFRICLFHLKGSFVFLVLGVLSLISLPSPFALTQFLKLMPFFNFNLF